MKRIKTFGALIIGAIFLYDFIITVTSSKLEQYEVIGMDVSKTTYLAYLLAITISFLSYGLTKQFENEDEDTGTQASISDR